jgi:hypothetical protein
MPTGMLRCRHGADRVMLGPPLGRAVLVCPRVPRPAYVGPQKALRGFSEVRRIRDVRLWLPRVMLDSITLPGNLIKGPGVFNAPK